MHRAVLADLQAVIAIARRGTFRAAAIDLGMSTTALSHSIRRLEESLGVRLFNRTTRSVALTAAGRQFVGSVGPALTEIQDALQAVQAQRETPAGLLRINAPPFAARQVLAPLVLEFLRRYPKMQVDLVTEGRLVDIVAEGFDLGVRVAGLVPADMIALSLAPRQRHAVVGSAGYFAAHPLPQSPGDLAAHDCIGVRLPNGALYRWQFSRHGKTTQVEVQGRLTLDEAGLARTAVLAGVGIGFFMEQDVEDDIASGRMIRVLEDWTPPSPGLCLYYPGRRNPSAGLAAFLALAREGPA